VETTATEKLEIRACGCCGPSAEEAVHVETGSVSSGARPAQGSRAATETVTKSTASTCDCGCETSGCDCGCECCGP
jgi:hypothetical protein